MIEWRWGLQPLSVRDSSANNLANVLDFDHFNLNAPQFSVPSGPFGTLCPNVASTSGDSQLLRAFAAEFGFPVS
jgi:phospholipase C